LPRSGSCAPQAGRGWSGSIGCSGLKAEAAWCGSSAWPAPMDYTANPSFGAYRAMIASLGARRRG
jgi:hypothetical protein